MIMQQQIIDEIKHIPDNKLAEVYDFIHYFRLGLQHEKQQPNEAEKNYPLRGTKINYQQPTEPVAIDDWNALK